MLTNCKYQLNFNLIYGLLPEKRVARQNWTLTNVHSVGWDIAFLNDDVCFIEGNDDWHVIDIQLAGPRKLVFDRYFK